MISLLICAHPTLQSLILALYFFVQMQTLSLFSPEYRDLTYEPIVWMIRFVIFSESCP